MAQTTSLVVAIPLFFLVMACLGLGNGSVFQLVPQRYGKQVGAATGILGAAGGLGGFLLPTLLGSFKQAAGSYAVGLMAFAGLAVVALVSLLIAQRNWIGNWIAEHGRVRPVAVVVPTREVEAA